MSLLLTQGKYWSWRSAFVAQLRKILGDDAVILANSAGAVSDPSLSGITIEMESCVGASSKLIHRICRLLVAVRGLS